MKENKREQLCVSYGDKEMLKWYREYQQRRLEGSSNDWSDILCTFDCLVGDDENADEKMLDEEKERQ